METLEQQTIGQIVASDYRKAKIFNKFDIDFCRCGGITLDEACAKERELTRIIHENKGNKV